MNPISGTASKAAVPSLIDSVLDKELFEYEIRMTERAGHASEIATEAKNNHVDVVVAVGGDGTVNEVARSLVHSDTALGILPCGVLIFCSKAGLLLDILFAIFRIDLTFGSLLQASSQFPSILIIQPRVCNIMLFNS